MNDDIPDTGKMVCAHCGAEQSKGKVAVDGPVRFECNSTTAGYMFPAFQSTRCLEMQRDQLRARVEQLENWCERMANILEEGGWESRAQNEFRKYMETKPKPEGLR
jgi:hypothetical protein